MEVYQQFMVDKLGTLFSDTLTAYGLAAILSELLDYQTERGGNVIIADKGPYYALICDPALERATAETRSQYLMPIKPIKTMKNASNLPVGIGTIDYEKEKERTNLYYAALRNNAESPEPNQDWNTYRAINPTTLPGYNAIVTNWWKVCKNPAILTIVLDVFASTPNDLAAAIKTWEQLNKANDWGIKAESTGQQLYNPDQGKGQNKAKANGISIGNVSNFWLIEWLKAVGFYEAGITRLVRGVKDRKTFVISPCEISYQENRGILNEFFKLMPFSETPTKFDILAAVRYTRALLTYFNENDTRRRRLLQRKRIKRRIVAGFYTAFYKDLGNAVATMNIAAISLPGWMEADSKEAIHTYVNENNGLLIKLEKLTQQFDEDHSDAFTLLQHLRDFVSGDGLKAFFRFTNTFPAYLMGMRERGKYAYPLTTVFIERLMMSTEPKLSEIIQNDGFQNIAYAIRQSTVTAQYRKKQGKRKYDVRYGLGQELSRKSRYPMDFIIILSDFLHKYNAENAQVMETRSGPYRSSINTSDIDEIVRLIDKFGSELVANLLVAYGYARVPREGDFEDEPQTEQENNS